VPHGTQEEVMKKISIRETRKILVKLDRVLEEEGEITITKRGNPVARIVGLNRNRKIPSHFDLRSQMPLLNGSEETIREDRNAR